HAAISQSVDDGQSGFGIRFFGLAVLDEFNADIEPCSAHIADTVVARGDVLDSVADQLANPLRIFGQLLIAHDIKCCLSCSNSDRIASKGVEVPHVRAETADNVAGKRNSGYR